MVVCCSRRESFHFVLRCKESLYAHLYDDVITKISTSNDSKVAPGVWSLLHQAVMSSSMSLSFMNFLFLVCQSCSRRPEFYFLLSSLPSFLPTFVLLDSPLCITHCNERVGCSGCVGGGGGLRDRSMSQQHSAASCTSALAVVHVLFVGCQ